MVFRANGVLRGKHIELDEPVPAFPDGSAVSVELRSRALLPAEAHRLIDELCGAMAGDSSIPGVFSEIERRRHRTSERPVSFDEPS